MNAQNDLRAVDVDSEGVNEGVGVAVVVVGVMEVVDEVDGSPERGCDDDDDDEDGRVRSRSSTIGAARSSANSQNLA